MKIKLNMAILLQFLQLQVQIASDSGIFLVYASQSIENQCCSIYSIIVAKINLKQFLLFYQSKHLIPESTMTSCDRSTFSHILRHSHRLFALSLNLLLITTTTIIARESARGLWSSRGGHSAVCRQTNSYPQESSRVISADQESLVPCYDRARPSHEHFSDVRGRSHICVWTSRRNWSGFKGWFLRRSISFK